MGEKTVYGLVLADKDDKRIKLKTGQLVRVLDKGANTYLGDVYLSSTFASGDSDEDLDTLGMVSLSPALVGKTLVLEAPARGGVYRGEAKPLAKAPERPTTGTPLTLKFLERSVLEQRIAWANLVEAAYPAELKDVRLGVDVNPGAWALESLLVALLEVASELKNRLGDPSTEGVVAGLAALAAAKKATPGAESLKLDKRLADEFAPLYRSGCKTFQDAFLEPSFFYLEPFKYTSGRIPLLQSWAGVGASLMKGTDDGYKNGLSYEDVRKFVSTFHREITTHVNARAGKIYTMLFGDRAKARTDLKLETPPSVMLVAVGDGTRTKGVLGNECEGTGIMAYQVSTEKRPTENPAYLDGVKVDIPNGTPLRPCFRFGEFRFARPAGGRQTTVCLLATGFDQGKTHPLRVKCGPSFKDGKGYEHWTWEVCFKTKRRGDTASAAITFERLETKTKQKDGSITTEAWPGPKDTAPGGDAPFRIKGGFYYDPSRHELTLPVKAFKGATGMTIGAASADAEELYYGVAVTLAFRPINLGDFFDHGQFIPESQTKLQDWMKELIEDVKEAAALYKSFKVTIHGGGIGKYGDETGRRDVGPNPDQTPKYGVSDSDPRIEGDWGNLRCTYVDFSDSGDTLSLDLRSFTDPRNTNEQNEYYRHNADLSRLRCWGMLGFICRSMEADGDAATANATKKAHYQRALDLFAAAPEEPQTEAYLAFVPPGETRVAKTHRRYYLDMPAGLSADSETKLPADVAPFDPVAVKKKLDALA